MRPVRKSAHQGFTLVESMVAFLVLAYGLLAIATFQSKLLTESGSSKARSEAIALAQQKIDEIRSYTNEQTLVANLEGSAVNETDTFPESVDDGTYPAVAEQFDGVNAQFSRQWNVAVSGNVADVTVMVSWDDPFMGAQSVSLDTMVTWRNPRGSADLTAAAEPLVPSATGRAHLGEGHIDAADIPGDADNGDGTSEGDFDDDGDLELVDNATGDVVLTLDDACQLVGEQLVCTDFVRIHGRVYIDKSASGMALSDVYILASDAAYCARDLADAGTTSPNGSYNYYDYTCYIGGGWHGNIGLLLNGANNNDAVCVGDPNADWADGTQAWKRYEMAKRRVYRGMLHKVDANGNEIKDANGNTLFYSKGVADAITLPDANWPERDYGHDFVVTRITGAGTGGGTASDCLPALTRADADPDSNPATHNLFDGVSSDFVCLNSDNIENLYEAGIDPNVYSPYLDYFDPAIYRARNSCPFDPSDPPSHRFAISGNIITATTPSMMKVMTSDGEDNCHWTINGTTTSYSCDVYAWENSDGSINGWDGLITVRPPASMRCQPGLSADEATATNPVSVSYANVDGTPSYVGNQHYACLTLASMQITGTITATGSNLDGGSVAASDGSPCTYSAASGTATYSCAVVESGVGAGWTGTITFTPPPSIPSSDCSPLSWSFTAVHEGDPSLVNNNSSCQPALYTYVRGLLTSTVTAMSDAELATLEFSADNANCYAGIYHDLLVHGDAPHYICRGTHYGSGWSGTISFADVSKPNVHCTPASYTAPSPVFGTVTGPSPVNCESGGSVTVEGFYRVYDLSRTQPVTPVMSGGGTCILNNGNPVPATGINVDVPYSCVTPWVIGTGNWSGSVTFNDTASKIICVDGSHPNPRVFAGIIPGTTLSDVNVAIAKNSGSCPSPLP